MRASYRAAAKQAGIMAQRRSFTSAAPGLLDTLLKRSSTPAVAQDTIYPGVMVPAIGTITQGDVKITALPNGMRVATQCNSSAPVATVSACIKAGSRYETDDVQGISMFLNTMLLRSTDKRWAHDLLRDLNRSAVTMTNSSTRDQFSVSASGHADALPVALGALTDQLVNLSFIEREVHDQLHVMEADVREKMSQPDLVLNENIHQAAFGDNTLGRGMYPTPSSMRSFTPEALRSWYKAFITPKRMVITGLGVKDHESFVDQVQTLLAGLPANSDVAETPAVYTGGDVRATAADYEGPTHVSLAFQAPGWNHKDLYAACILQTVMGSAGTFSSGGPGKGMHSRMYSRVMSRNDVGFENVHSFNLIYSDSGVFGNYFVVDPVHAGRATDVMVRELQQMTRLSTEEFERAKKLTVSSVLMSLESHAALAEEVALSVAAYGKYHVNQTVPMLRAVTKADVEKFAEKLLKSPLAVATYGKASQVPRYDVLKARFNA